MAALTAAAVITSILGVASAGTQVYGAIQQADAGKKESDFNAAQAEQNAELADKQAEDAIQRGDQAANNLKGKIGQVVGSQRAGFASQGIDVNSGSAAQVQDDARMSIERDMVTVKNNAWREALGFRVEAQNYRSNASMGRAAGENRYNNTLLTGGLQAIDTGVKTVSAYRSTK